MTNEQLKLCSHLWNHLVVDFRTLEIRMCCKTSPIKISPTELEEKKSMAFLNANIYENARKEMLEGGQPSICNYCWELENKQMPSHRTSNEDWERAVKNNKANNNNLSQSQAFTNLDIQLGNTCDLKCIYCNEDFSTSWALENKTYGPIGNKYQSQNKSDMIEYQKNFDFYFWDLFEKNKTHFERIAFLGGEPLISQNFYEILSRLNNYYEKPSKKLEINIITNLNTPEFYFNRFLVLLPQLTEKFNITINISMESWGLQAEFIRSGLRFDRFLNNFKKLLSLNLPLKFITITSLNLLCLSSLEKYLRWVREQELSYKKIIEVHYNIVNYPAYLSLDLATSKMYKYLSSSVEFIENEILKKEESPSWANYNSKLKRLATVVEKRNNVESDVLNEFKKFILAIEVRRKLDYRSVFTDPEFQELIN